MASSSVAADAAQEDRHAEERAVLSERLRRSLATVVEDNNDLREYNATLKKSQSQLLERTTELSELVDRLRGELSNAAAANARLKRDLSDTKQALERETAQAVSLSSELNAYRETEGAIATALAAVTAKGSGAASPNADGGAPAGEDGVPAWLEAEARAGGEARARSLKLQVLALRQALFRVARKAVARGADSAQVADFVSEAVADGAGADLTGVAVAAAAQLPATSTPSSSAAATSASGVGGTAGAAAAAGPPVPANGHQTTGGGSVPQATGRPVAVVAGAPVSAQDSSGAAAFRAAPGAAAGADASDDTEEGEEDQQRGEADEASGSGDDSDVVMPPAPISMVHATAEDESTPKTQTPLSDHGDVSTNAAVGLLGMVLAPPIVLADALAAVSEAFFGTDEDEEGFDEE